MPINYTPSILPGSDDPIVDADVIQTANIVGYALERMSRGQRVRFATEGDALYRKAPEDPAARKAWKKARIGEYAELAMLWETVRLVGPLVGDVVDMDTSAYAELAPFKDRRPAIVGQRDEARDGSVTDWQDAVQQRARAFCKTKPEGAWPNGLGYRGQGSYTGVVVWSDPDNDAFPHFCTTRHAFTAHDNHVTRWHPDHDESIGGLPALGDAGYRRRHGMQATNRKQQEIRDTEYMHFFGADPNAGDVVGYNHGLPLAIAKLRSSRKLGTPVEVVGASAEPEWSALTRKASSCFQCTVYMEANHFPPTSVHLGRGESWVPPYPENYLDLADQVGAQTCLDQYYTRCDLNLRYGIDVLAHTDAIKRDKHKAAFGRLKDFMDANHGAQRSAELILDAVTMLDKDYLRVIRTLWPADDRRTIGDLIAECTEEAEGALRDMDHWTAG